MQTEGKYACRYHLSMTDDSIERIIYGIDTLQALHLALQMMRVDLLRTNGASDWKFLGEPGLGGLPIHTDPET
jgi:hypothetical protein